MESSGFIMNKVSVLLFLVFLVLKITIQKKMSSVNIIFEVSMLDSSLNI